RHVPGRPRPCSQQNILRVTDPRSGRLGPSRQPPPAKPEAWNNEWLKAMRPVGPTAAPDSQTAALHRSSLLRPPLTPALSRREREKPSPRGERSSALDGSQRVGLLFPLPPADGQGEGEGR